MPVECPKCGQWFDGVKAHHAHYDEHYKTKKGQRVLDRVTCGDPGPIVRTIRGRSGTEIRIHGERRP